MTFSSPSPRDLSFALSDASDTETDFPAHNDTHVHKFGHNSFNEWQQIPINRPVSPLYMSATVRLIDSEDNGKKRKTHSPSDRHHTKMQSSENEKNNQVSLDSSLYLSPVSVSLQNENSITTTNLPPNELANKEQTKVSKSSKRRSKSKKSHSHKAFAQDGSKSIVTLVEQNPNQDNGKVTVSTVSQKKKQSSPFATPQLLFENTWHKRSRAKTRSRSRSPNRAANIAKHAESRDLYDDIANLPLEQLERYSPGVILELIARMAWKGKR